MGKKQLKAARAARQQQIINAARAENRDMTAEERQEFEALQGEINQLDAEIRAEEGQEGGEGQELGEGDENRDAAVRAERQRVTDISAMCRDFGMDPGTYIQNGSTIDQVRQAVLDHLRSTAGPINAGIRIGDDAGDKFRRAASDALIIRAGMQPEHPEEGSRQMVGMSFRDLAIECLQMDGREGLNRSSSDDLFAELQRQFFNPTAAFPAILDQAIEKSYTEGHRNVPVTFDQWVRKGSLKDFKTHDNYYIAGPVGEFLEVPEGAELKHDVFGDEKLPTRKLKTYGRQFTLSRQAFINDDIDLVTSIPRRYAAAARKTLNKQCYQVLTGNPAIYDGTPLFGANHKNVLASGTGITKEAMQAMIMALQTQEDQFHEAIIVRPATIIVPSGYAFDMYTLFFSPSINTEGNTQAVNPLYRYRNTIKIIEDPTINVLCGGFGNIMPWWLLGDTNDTDFMQVDYLNGEEIPKIRRSEVAGQLGIVWDIYIDWGVAVMDYRGAIKNPGTKIESPLGLAME